MSLKKCHLCYGLNSSTLFAILLLCAWRRTLWWWVSIGLGNGLAPSGNKPLSEPVLTQIYVTSRNHMSPFSHTRVSWALTRTRFSSCWRQETCSKTDQSHCSWIWMLWWSEGLYSWMHEWLLVTKLNFEMGKTVRTLYYTVGIFYILKHRTAGYWHALHYIPQLYALCFICCFTSIATNQVI